LEEILLAGHSWKNILKFRRRTMFNLRMNMSLNSLIALMVGIKYCGALHLWCYTANALLQISGGSAAFKYQDVFYQRRTTFNLKMNMSLNSLMAFMVGILSRLILFKWREIPHYAAHRSG